MTTLNQIFWKGFWKNKRNYGLYILSGSFLVAIIFFFLTFGSFLENLITDNQGNYLVEYLITYSFTLAYLLMEVFLILSTICYARSRAREYRIYHLMGMTKKQRRVLIAKELIVTAACSICCGLLLGSVFTIMTGKMVGILNPQYIQYFHLDRSTFLAAACSGGMEFGFMFFILESLVFYLGLDEVLQFGVKSGKKPKKHPILWKISLLVFIVCFLMQNSYWGIYVSMPIALGLYLMHVSLWGDLFQKRKQKEQRYYRSVIWLNEWYYRFYSNINMIFVVSMLVFIAIFMYTLSIGDTIPLKDEELYKYDVVWMTDTKSEAFLEELETEYEVEIEKQPCIYLTTPDAYEHVGISQTDYERLTGEKVQLKGDEVGINYQKRREDRNAVGIDYGDTTPCIHMGRPEADLWISTGQGGNIPSARFDTSYRLKQTKNAIIWGAFGTGDEESVIIFQDEYFQKYLENDLLVSMNVHGKQDEVREEIYAYIEKYEKDNYRIYDRKTLEKLDEVNQLLHIVLYILSFGLIIGCSVMIAGIKIGNDAVLMEQKYIFYRKLGMPEKMWKTGIRKECRTAVIIAVISGMVVGIIYVIREMQINGYGKECLTLYGSVVLAALAIIGSVYLILILVATRITTKKIEKVIS